MKSFKVKVALLSLGLFAGLTYEAFAETPKKGSKQQHKKMEKQEIVDKSVRKTLTIEQHTAEIVAIDKNVTEIFVANPAIADVTVNAPGVAYIYGKKPGVTTVFAGTKDGKTALNMEVDVTYNLRPLKRAIQTAYPNERVNPQSTPSGIVLDGEVSSPIVSKEMVNIAQRYIGDKDTVINNLSISSPTQVYISVKVAEVSRTVLHQLNISLGVADQIGDFAFGILTGRPGFATGLNNPFTDNGNPGFIRASGKTPLGTIGGNLTSKHYPSLSVVGILDALNQEGLSTVLAEPNLIALSGETAKVLVGGEYPFPVPQGNQSVTIQFKQYGVQLDVTPTVLSGNLINLHVRPEVSALDPANGTSVPLTNGSIETIPAIKTRRTETTVELASGSSLAIAGMLTNSLSNTLNEYPGLAELPVLGALFRSPQFTRAETELVIIVTPYLVEPVKNHDLMTGWDNLQYASFLGMILSGRLNNPRNSPEKPFDGFTSYLSDSGDAASVSDVSFETNLADGTGIPTNDQARDSHKNLFNRPEDLGQGSDVNLAGYAGFYTE